MKTFEIFSIGTQINGISIIQCMSDYGIPYNNYTITDLLNF